MRMRTSQLLLVQIALLASGMSAQAQPETGADYGAQPSSSTRGTIVTMPPPPDAPAGHTRPNASAPRPDTPPRGIRMSRVLRAYGDPVRRHAAIGQPPITRWDYPDYRLYFEYDHVLHAVVPQDPAPIAHRDELTAAAR